jgi:trigger factor
VRGALLLEKIAELENVDVTDEDISKEIEMMANYYGVDAEQIRASINQQQSGEANLANNLRTRKAVEALVKNAKVSEGEWIDPAHAPVEEAAAAEEEKPKAKTKKAKAKADDSEEAVKTEETEEKPKKKSAKKEK